MRPVIVARGLSIARGGQLVVRAEELDISPGVTALVGPNGSGKSTLLHAIAGLAVVGGGGAAYLVRRRSSASGTESES